MESKNRIRVFISSKCGGERLNLHQAASATSNGNRDIVDVAIRTSYDLVRRALKTSLEATGIVQTYVFEDEPASTSTASEDYLYEIDRSDVCLFLIDNFDEKFPDGLLAEITRAQSLKRKCIYLFLNDPRREKTSIQQNLTGAKGDHFSQIGDIREFINQGYKAVIDDVLKTYQKYCNPRRVFDEAITSSVEITANSFPVDIVDIDKQLFSNLGLTRTKFASLLSINGEPDTRSSELDELSRMVLDGLLGEKVLNAENLASLVEALSRIQPPALHELVRQRWTAILSLYSGDLPAAIVAVRLAYEQYSTDPTIPAWLINDTLIDWRNLEMIDYERRDVLRLLSQEKIDERGSMVFFPLVDRFSSNIADEIWSRNFRQFTGSPYSMAYYGVGDLIGHLSNYLFAAIYYGSYTHMLLALRETQKVLLDFVRADNNLLNKTQLMRIGILLGDQDGFGRIMDKYKSSLSHSTAKEILALYMLADTKPLAHQKALWKVLLFGELGYYLSDTDYESVSSEILIIARAWLDEDVPSVTLGQKLIRSLSANRSRLRQGVTLQVALAILEKKYYRFAASLFDALSELHWTSVTREELVRLLQLVKEALKDKALERWDWSIKRLLIQLRKDRDDFGNDIDALVLEHDPGFYEQEYRLEVVPGNRVAHIVRYLDSIKARNESQGKGGRFILYSDAPYLTIQKIIEVDKISLPPELLSDLLAAIAGTLFSPAQSYSEKTSAIRALLFLRRQDFAQGFDWSSYYAKLTEDVARLELAHDDPFRQDSQLVLRLHLTMLHAVFGEDVLQALLEVLALISNSSDREIIDSLIALDDFLSVEKKDFAESALAPVVVQYTSAFCFHQDENVRYHTVKVLYDLADSEYGAFVASRLAKMMEDDDYGVKLAIVRQAHLMRARGLGAFNYVMAKARIDNNYLVRTAVAKYGAEAR